MRDIVFKAINQTPFNVRRSVLLSCLCIQLSFAQPNPKDIITKDQALTDLKVLEISLREIHPSFYRYTTKTEFDIAFANARSHINGNISLIEFTNLVAPIVAMIRCGHTHTLIPYVTSRSKFFPADVKVISNRLFVLYDYSAKKIPGGSEVIEINGISTQEILNSLSSRTNADGYGQNFKDRVIEQGFAGNYAAYFSQPDSFSVKLSVGEEIRAVTLPALSGESINKEKAKRNLGSEKLVSFEVDHENNVGILKIRTFFSKKVKQQSGQNLKRFIRKSFRKLNNEKVANLIIDIRRNTGGRVAIPPLLFSYFTDEDFKFRNRLLFRHGYKFSYPQYLNRNKLNDWVNRKLDRKINDTTYEWTLHRNTKPYKARKTKYAGKLFIIINGMTTSAATEFASLLYANNKGTFVGEESGGDYNGVNGFDQTYLRLPNSGVGVLIAGWRSVMNWDNNQLIGHGIPPTYLIRPTIEDMLNGRDAEMAFIYDLIKKQKN